MLGVALVAALAVVIAQPQLSLPLVTLFVLYGSSPVSYTHLTLPTTPYV